MKYDNANKAPRGTVINKQQLATTKMQLKLPNSYLTKRYCVSVRFMTHFSDEFQTKRLSRTASFALFTIDLAVLSS